RKLDLAEPAEALGQQDQDHDGDRADRLVGHHRVHDRSPEQDDAARDQAGEHGDGRHHERVHRLASPSGTTSWWTTMTARSWSIPRAKEFGATEWPPIRRTRRVRSSAVSPPQRTGTSR